MNNLKINQNIEVLENNWIEIYKRNDALSLQALLTEDFLYTSPVGELVTRQTYLSNLRDLIVKMAKVDVSDFKIRTYNDLTAVVTATWTVDEAYRGHVTKGPCRITRVWVKQDMGWKACAFQVSFVTTY